MRYEKTSKILLTALFFAEAILTAYFFYAQPLCEPCLSDTLCPPCISEQQVITFWIGIIIALTSIIYLAFINFRKTNKKHN